MKRHARYAILVSIAGSTAAFAACSSSGGDNGNVTCGPGTELSGSTCVPSAADSGDMDTGVPGDTGTDAATDAPVSDRPTFAGAVSVSPAGKDSLLVTWAAGSDATTASSDLKYAVYVASKAGDENYSAAKIVTVPGATSVLLTDLDPGTYFVVVRARNAAGKEDTNTVEKSSTPTEDTTAPTFAGATMAESAPGARVKLTWAAATDDHSDPGGISYLVFYATDTGKETYAIPFAVSAPGATSLVTPPLPKTGTKYYFVVRARDAAGNVSDTKTEVSSESGSDTNKPVFGGCNAAVKKDAGGITVFWDPASDDVTPSSAIKYVVYGGLKAADIDFTKPLANFVGGSSGVVTGLKPGTTYYLVCRAQDASANEDDNKTIVFDTTDLDSIPPTFGGLASIANIDSTSVDLTWSAASDDQTDPSNIKYAIYESTTTPVDLTTPKYTVTGLTTYKVTGLMPASKLYWVVRAFDAASNHDANNVEKTATTLVSFSLNVQLIFTSNCAVPGCHQGSGAPYGMTLEDGKSYVKIVGVNAAETAGAPHVGGVLNRVKPSDSANSWLYKKISGTADVGELMPPPATGGSLTAAEKDLIKAWIDQGALNN